MGDGQAGEVMTGALRPAPRTDQVTIVQNCYVVRDLDAACARMHALYGMGPFVGGGIGTLEEHHYRGRSAPPILFRGVFVQSGDLNVELLQLLSDAPSAFHDMFPSGGDGFHHTAVFCHDYQAARQTWAEAGCPVVSEFITAFGAQICYVDARATHGHMVELYPENEIIRAMFRKTRMAAEQWDGRELIVPWARIS